MDGICTEGSSASATAEQVLKSPFLSGKIFSLEISLILQHKSANLCIGVQYIYVLLTTWFCFNNVNTGAYPGGVRGGSNEPPLLERAPLDTGYSCTHGTSRASTCGYSYS